MATDFEMPTLRQLWQRWRHVAPPSGAVRRRNMPPGVSHQSETDVMVRRPALSPRAERPSWSHVQHTVRQWPSGMPITSDLIAQVFGVGRGQAWRWLERLERAGLVYVTEDPPNAKGARRKRRWVR